MIRSNLTSKQGLRTLFIAFLLLSIYSCNSSSYNKEELAAIDAAIPEEMVEDYMENDNEGIANSKTERKLITEGWIEFETADIEITKKSIYNAVDKYNGYISIDDEYTSDNRNSVSMTIRVPSKHFENLLRIATEGIDKVDRKNINVNDVTEEFLDVEARLKTKKELENRYLTILNKANTVSEILEIEKEIGQLRGEIESIEGRLNFLQNKISYSTLHIIFYEYSSTNRAIGRKLKNSFKEGWDRFIQFTIELVSLWPFILLLVIIFTIVFIVKK